VNLILNLTIAFLCCVSVTFVYAVYFMCNNTKILYLRRFVKYMPCVTDFLLCSCYVTRIVTPNAYIKLNNIFYTDRFIRLLYCVWSVLLLATVGSGLRVCLKGLGHWHLSFWSTHYDPQICWRYDDDWDFEVLNKSEVSCVKSFVDELVQQSTEVGMIVKAGTTGGQMKYYSHST